MEKLFAFDDWVGHLGIVIATLAFALFYPAMWILALLRRPTPRQKAKRALAALAIRCARRYS